MPYKHYTFTNIYAFPGIRTQALRHSNQRRYAAILVCRTPKNEEPKPRLPDSIARPITIMPLSRMENTTFVKPSIIDFHDMGLRTVLTVRTPKEQRLFNT
ncbi:hypothetical protein TNCV_535881 [Trichonephila clavipes]|nr:hypothetical protein TNCV_535881 [Trichonephila clavipes]